MTERRWIMRPQPDGPVLEDLEVPDVIRRLLWQRGIRTRADAEKFLEPSYETHRYDPFSYRLMDAAVDRLIRAIRDRERITVYGDYDADGITATAIMVEALSALQANVNWYIPQRLGEGYGLNSAAITELADQGTNVLVTVDCGTSNVAEIEHANSLGLEVIVLDHHQAPPALPPAVAIINPHLPDQTYPFRGHSSGGVAYTVAQALMRATKSGRTVGRELPDGWEKWLLDLVAVSTVADMMPLRDENRLLVRYGLQVLRKNRRPGLRALFAAMGGQAGSADESTIGFQLAPRINAAGRLHHGSLALQLLLAHDPVEATAFAEELQALNLQRQRLTELAVAEAIEQVGSQGEQAGYVAYAPHWSPGIIGLIAGRIVERVWRPVVVMTKSGEDIVGSGRSIPGVDITAHLRSDSRYFRKYGGHAGACGFTLVSDGQRSAFSTWFQSSLRPLVTGEAERRPIEIDAIATLSEVNAQTVDKLEQLAPFGMENNRPRLLIERVQAEEAATVGARAQHVRFTARQGQAVAKIIGFGAADHLETIHRAGTVDIVVEASWNEWNGRRDIQLKLVDLRPSV